MKTAEDILKTKTVDLITTGPNSTIYEALKIMTENRIGAILVKDDEEIIGIWTERDLMHNTLEKGFDPRKAIVGDYMTVGLRSAEAHETIYQLWDKFLGMRLRHLLVKKEGHYIGILSTGDVNKASLNEKSQELNQLNAMMSWEYYENWHWTPKKK